MRHNSTLSKAQGSRVADRGMVVLLQARMRSRDKHGRVVDRRTARLPQALTRDVGQEAQGMAALD